MIKPELKIYFILGLILTILFLLVVFLPFNRKGENKKISPTNFPTPTSYDESMIRNQSPIISPTIPLVRPTFTGGIEEIPQELADYSSERMNLKQKTPLQEKNFLIEYDYSQDKFIVTLSSPQDQSKINFENWLKENYPLIKINEDFIFK